MIVTAGTAKSQPEEGRRHAVGHLGQDLLAIDLGVGVAADEMNRPAAIEAGGDEQLAVAAPVLVLRQLISGKLFREKDVERLVLIQRANHIISVAPGMDAFPVRLVAVGLGVACHVKPVLRPALAIVRRCQQALDRVSVCFRTRVMEEACHIAGRGRQAGQIERQPADKRCMVGGWRRGESGLLQTRENERINGRPDPFGGAHGRRRLRLGREERPVPAVLGC